MISSTLEDWRNFMNLVGLDVFQFILSFLPPIPFLFKLQRVSKHWRQLCLECMEEDCTELYWDHSAITNKSNKNPSELFFKILKPFKKLNVIVLKNESVDVQLLKTILVDWKGKYKIEADNTEYSAYVPLQYYGGKIKECKLITERNNISQQIQVGDRDDTGSELSNGFQQSLVEGITVIASQLQYLDQPFLLCCFCLLKAFPKLRFAEISLMYTGMNSPSIDTWIESMGARELFPNVEFKKNIYEMANQILMDTQDFEKAVDYYMSRFEKDLHFKKIRLESFRRKYLSTRDAFDSFHQNACKIVNFFVYHSPFGMDSKLKDINGYNIIQLAIIFSCHETVEFILRYLTALESDDNMQVHNELQELFSSNNGIDGRNAVFSSISKSSKENDHLLRLMIQYNISFNAPSSDGSTIAHYLCQFGKLEYLKTIWFSFLKELPLERKQYFLDLNLKNHTNEYPIEVCKKLKMNNMMKYLKENAHLFGITYLPNMEEENPIIVTQKPSPLTVRPPTQNPQNSNGCQLL
nr:unnamed protein product [Naegleria fowleri]